MVRPRPHLVLALWLVAAAASAQAPAASVRVRVTDDTGAVIVGARVSATQGSTPARTGTTGPVGDVLIDGLTPGRADIRVEAPGFEPRDLRGHRVREGVTRVDVRLQIEKLSMTVDVARDARERAMDPRSDTFSRVLTPADIAQLPDDPEELEKVLTQMAGPGASFRVNGFGGGRLPPKNQIRQIRFSLNTFSAETHDIGMPMVDITTQPGLDRWHGGFSFGFRNDALTARYAYGNGAGDESVWRGGFFFDGPVWKNRTSLSFSLDGTALSDVQTILAATPAGTLTAAPARATSRGAWALLVEHALTKTHTARLELTSNRTSIDNLGVGGTNLPERAYGTDQSITTLRLSDAGPIGRRLYSEARLQTTWGRQESRSDTIAPAIVVLDAFSAGGAQVSNERRSWEVDAAWNVDGTAGKRHALRAGALLQAGRFRATDAGNALGTFTFPGLAAYTSGRPASFTRREGNPTVAYEFYRAGVYVQDDVKAHKTLTLSFGLRHEFQSRVDGKLNLSPRVGFTWAPRPNAKLVLRGGAGVVYQWFEPALYEQTLRVDGLHQYDVVVRNPGYPDPLDGGQADVLPPSRLQRDPDLRLPRIRHASLVVQSMVRPMTTLVISATRQRGSSLFRGLNLNAPFASGARPFPEFGNITQVESSGRSAVDRLDVTASHAVLRQMTLRYMLSATYSLGRQRNDTDGAFSVPADGTNPGADWGPSASDVRHRGSLLFMGSLPFRLRLTAIAAASSAPPYNITSGIDSNGDAVFNDRPRGVGRNSSRGSAQADVMLRLGWSAGFGTRKATDGQGGPNLRAIRRDAERDPMGALGALTGQASRIRLEFYGQVYNALNRVNRVGYRGVISSPLFGRPTASLPPRRVELGVRLDF